MRQKLFLIIVLLFATIINAQLLTKGPLAKDGYMESLKVDGVEFFDSKADISRGTYIHQGGVIDLNKEGCAFEVTYGPVKNNAMTINIKSNSDKEAKFFAILRNNIRACTIDNSELKPTRPLAHISATKSSWLLDGKVLLIKGHDKLWPWSNDTTVVQVTLAPKETAKLSFKARLATEDEQNFIDNLPKPPVQTEADLAKGNLPDLEIFTPKNWQVIQRQTANSTPVRISGMVRCGCSFATIKIKGTDKNDNPFEKNLKLPVSKFTKGFDLTINLPAGGWYQLELTTPKVNKPVIVEKFGVGELFVTAGQSNSTNCGQFKTKQTSGMVAAFNGLNWRLGNDPFWGTHDTSKKGSTWASLGDILYKKYNVPIGFAVTGHGGTNTVQWQPDNNKNGLFHHTLVRLWQLGPKGYRAILWHQGESDCGYNSTDKTYNNMVRLIEASRQATNYPVPWFVAKVSYRPNTDPQLNEAVRNAHQKLWDDGIAMKGPDTDILVGDDRDFDSKGIHFSPKGLKVMAQMWANDITPWLDEQLKK